MDINIPSSAAADHELRINAMIKILMEQRDIANNQLVKLGSDLAVSRAETARADAHAAVAATKLASASQAASVMLARIFTLETSLEAALDLEVATRVKQKATPKLFTPATTQ